MRFPTMWYVRPAKPQITLRIQAVWSESLLVAWIFCECKATDWTSFGVFKLLSGLHRLICVYTFQNTTLLEITCHSSYKAASHQYWTMWVLHWSQYYRFTPILTKTQKNVSHALTSSTFLHQWCLFVLTLNISVNNCSVMPGWFPVFPGLTSSKLCTSQCWLTWVLHWLVTHFQVHFE